MSNWISVKEKLPEVNADGDWSDDVLVLMRRYNNSRTKTGEYTEIFVGYYSPDEGWYTMCHNYCHQVGVIKMPPYPLTGRATRTTDNVIYWQPLPAPPSKEDDVFDEEEIHEKCTVQIWRNSKTGEESVGWWENGKEADK